ncbi:MAG: ABC transporter ATP-binding protein [Bacteroidia bacterium]
MSAAKEHTYSTWRVVLRILGLVRPYRAIFWLTLLLVVAQAVLAPIRPKLVQLTIDGPIADFDLQGLQKMTWLMIGVLVLESVFRYGFSYASSWLGQSAIRDLRQRIFDHLSRMRLRFFDRTPLGTLTTRTVTDVEAVGEVFSQGLLTIVGDVLQLLAVLIFMFSEDWRLSLVSLSVLPLLLISTYVFKEKVRKAFQDVRTHVARLNAFLQEHISGMSIVQIFNREAEEHRRFKAVNGALNKAHLKSVLYYSVFFPVVEIITAASLGLLVWWGARAALEGVVTEGMIIAFILYVNQLFRPIRLLADKFNSLQMGVVASERVFRLLDAREYMQDTGNKRLSEVKGAVSFDRVWFSYDGETDVLRDISFSLEPGRKLALVGPTGAGKSSIINVLGRFYEYQRGEVYIDGTPLRELALDEVQKHVGVILQDVFLFSGTIEENINMKNPAISLEYIRAMAEKTGINKLIDRLPGGYQYRVMERGSALSTGQRQLLAFLRVMVYNPAILVLDEATASIDSETEAMLQTAMKSLLENRTAIIIAHRLSTITDADEILVIDQGRVVERGTHQGLLQAGGHYEQLYCRQFE